MAKIQIPKGLNPAETGDYRINEYAGRKGEAVPAGIAPGTDRTPELLTPGRLYQGGTDHESPPLGRPGGPKLPFMKGS
jgi:hypothetical protein